MTARELLNFFEGYYGEKYTGYFLDAMLDYLQDCAEPFLIAARKVVILRFSRTFGKVPDIAVIESNIDEIFKERDKLWEKNRLPEPPVNNCVSVFTAELRNEINSDAPLGRSLLDALNESLKICR